MRKVSEPLGIYDVDTGALQSVILPLPKRSGGRWMKLYQDGILDMLRRHPEARPYVWLMPYLAGMCKWANIIPSAATTAKRHDLARSTVAKAYAELLKAEFIIKREGVYYISPLVAWKGDPKMYDQACRELFAETQRYPALAGAR